MSNLGNQQLGDIILGTSGGSITAGYGQAQAYIINDKIGFAQAQARITRLAFDAATESVRTDTSTTYQFDHTPVTSNPRAIVIAIQAGINSSTFVTAVTYGGVSLALIASGNDNAGEFGDTDLWFVGQGIPSGTQQVSATLSTPTTNDTHFVVMSFTASSDVVIIDSDSLSQDRSNPSVVMSNKDHVALTVASTYSGVDAPASITVLSTMTEVHNHDFGAFSSKVARQTYPKTTDFTAGFTIGADDNGFAAISMVEAPQAYGQAQGSIRPPNQGYAQAQATILQTYYVHAQAQGLIKQTYYNFAQAQSFIVHTIQQYAQAQAFIIKVSFQPAQAQARLIAFDVPQHAQALAEIKGNHAHGQAQAYILGLAAWFKLKDTASPLVDSIGGNLGVVTGGPIYSEPPYDTGHGEASIRFNNAYAVDTTPGIIPVGAAARAVTFWFKTSSLNKQTVVSYGTDSTRQMFEISLNHGGTENVAISVFGENITFATTVDDNVWHFVVINYFANASQIFIYVDGALEGVGFLSGALNTIMSGTGLVLGANHSAKTDIFDDWLDEIKIYTRTLTLPEIQAEFFRRSAVGQAQALIVNPYPLMYAQAQAQIKHPEYWVLGQAQAEIVYKRWAHGQAQTQIRTVYNSSGQAQATLSIQRHRHGQANALIWQPSPTFFGQAQAVIGGARISQVPIEYAYKDSARAARISQAAVEIVYREDRYARLSQFAVEFVAATVRNYNVHGQANAWIEQTYNGFGQAQAYIGHFVHGQAQAKINSFDVNAHGQAQAQIKLTGNIVHAQVQAYIRPRVGFGLARARINRTYVDAHGQAQALISIRKTNVYGQAQAMIRYQRQGYAQAAAMIGFFAHAQAQARIISFAVPKHGQAMGYIKANINVPPDGPSSLHQSYLVRYNGHDLPGYAQSESYTDAMNIVDHFPAMADFSLAQYTGLQNKLITLDMLLWEPDYNAIKNRLSYVGTILHSAKGFTRLYIQHRDSYFLAITSNVSTSPHASRMNRLLVYTVEFEAKPWVISEALYEVSGVGVVETTGRTLYDGTWTPTRLIVSGTDVTITGVNEFGVSTGSIITSGVSYNLIIDTEQVTATMAGINRNDLIVNKDFYLYVGPGKTYFTITGADSCIIQYNNRWLLPGGSNTRQSQQIVAVTPIIDTKGTPPSIEIPGIRHGLALAEIITPIKTRFGQARAVIVSPIKQQHANAAALIFSNKKLAHAQAKGSIKRSSRSFGQARAYITNPAVPPPSISGEAMPTSDPSGWTRMFEDDFTTNIPEGSFSITNSTKWGAYPDTWFDTSGNGRYSPAIVSQHDSMLDVYMRQINGIWRVAAPTPKLPVSTNYHTKVRIAARFKADRVLGFKTAWLLWPDSNDWPPDGEIDFPEGDLPGTISGFMHRQDATSGSDQDFVGSSATYDQWHTAIIEWEAGSYCRFILDGITLGTFTNRVPATPMHYVLQCETRLSGGPPPSGAAAHIYLDWFVMWTK